MARGSESETPAFEAGGHAARDGNCYCEGTLRARCRVTRRNQATEDAEAGVTQRPQTAKLIDGREISAGMRTVLLSLVVCTFSIAPIRADLTIVYSTAVEPARQAQKPDATPDTVAATENMTIKVKGDKARIDAPPHMTAIFDGTTGELINLLNDQKSVVRISPDKMRAIADMLDKFGNNKAGSQKPRLIPTGQKEMVNGYDTEQYTYDGPDFKATYWIAPNYPTGPAVPPQLQSIKSDFGAPANPKMPDFRDFPGLPI